MSKRKNTLKPLPEFVQGSEEYADYEYVSPDVPVRVGESMVGAIELGAEESTAFANEAKEQSAKRLDEYLKLKIYDNGENLWKTIARAYNEHLGIDKTTSAMALTHGVLVMVKDGNGVALQFISGVGLHTIEHDGEEKWVIR